MKFTIIDGVKYPIGKKPIGSVDYRNEEERTYPASWRDQESEVIEFEPWKRNGRRFWALIRNERVVKIWPPDRDDTWDLRGRERWRFLELVGRCRTVWWPAYVLRRKRDRKKRK